jgi:hypothetical protein
MVAAFVRGALLLSLVATLSGCAQAQISALRDKCDFSSDPRFASIRSKVGLSIAEREAAPTLRQIDDNSKPTPEQREALLEFDEANAPCRQGAMAFVSKYGSADMVGLYQELSLARTNQLKLLIDGEITFGQYRNNTYQMLARANQIAAQYERAQSMANAAASQAAAVQFSSTMQAFQTFNRQPTITTCNSLGGSINCYSR